MLEHIDGITHKGKVAFRDGDVGNRVVRIFVSIEFFILDDDGSVISQLVRAHLLKVQLNGASTYILILACELIQCVGASPNQILQGPFTGSVSEAIVDGFVAQKRVFIDRHNETFLQKYQKKLSTQKDCAL